ncbi:Serine/threonine-protein kinase VRK1 [Schistosoma japonicum]|uniref:Serine/threonine-protein kinase VRK1 n=1 Tax=Schistosoma japonicum TaxID=6182 RepID=A0A4Z2CW87_SCHJA|nr:Serine/threonine-protein kinase VRK1 [Schistosoma japonicum]
MSVRKCKSVKATGHTLAQPLEDGTVILDAFKRKWITGSAIGQGGFGRIYSAKLEGEKIFNYVVKIEPQGNGPLFTEMHFYMRACSEDSIKSWKVKHSLKYLGIPRYISSGSINLNKTALRYLVMDRFSGDFETTLKNHKISTSGILEVCANVLNALEYIHSKDYAHADIKASNLLHGISQQEVYLADFGLVHLFRSKGVHSVEKSDPKFRHNGTIEFCSRDAHAGLPPSRRGDLEILAYNLIHWLARSHPNVPQLHSTGLPWGHLISDPKLRANVPDRVKVAVAALKEKTMKNPAEFILQAGYGPNPDILAFIQSIIQLGYTDAPDYIRLRQFLYSAKRSLSNKQTTVTVASSCRVTIDSNETGIKASPSRRKYVTKHSSKSDDSRALNSVENLDPVYTNCKTPESLPNKRPRRRLPGRSKQLENISPSITSSFEVDSVKSPKILECTNHSSKRTHVNSLNSCSKHLNSPATETSAGDNGLPSVVSSSRHMNCSHGDTSFQQRVRTRLIDIFSDSDDDNKKLMQQQPSSVSPKHNLSKSRKDALKSTLKLQSPKKLSPSVKPKRQQLTGSASKRSLFKSPENTSPTVDRRRSGWCQTSPELLAVAKAEVLGRRALKLAEMGFR